jgi:hypothetical protein
VTSAFEWSPARADMRSLAEAHREAFQLAEPFPHAIIDSFLPASVVADLIAQFPGPQDGVWGAFENRREIKLALNDEAEMPGVVRHVIQQMNSQVAIEFLEDLTGISGLVADPQLLGGGLHQIKPGGVLKVHADFDMHEHLKLHRRLNAILYLNENWDESYGGALELWNLDMSKAVQSVYPIANRLVVFATTDSSWHGHPDPLTCPPDRTRRSMAWYYYTAVEAPRGRGHGTVFKARPGEVIETTGDRVIGGVKRALRPMKDRVGH